LATAVTAADPQPQAFHEKCNFQHLSKKKHKVKKNWKKTSKNILKLESKKMGSFQMYEKS
jgi:hypothetical protein